jgi:hypothetical protein
MQYMRFSGRRIKRKDEHRSVSFSSKVALILDGWIGRFDQVDVASKVKTMRLAVDAQTVSRWSTMWAQERRCV